jgi:hypothetical protein
MIPFFLYESTTGRVLATATYDERGDGAAAGTRVIAAGEIEPLTEYAPNGVKTDRPRVVMAINKTTVIGNGVDSATITMIPVGSLVSIYSGNEEFATATVTVNDGTLTMTFNAAGPYRVLVRLFPNVDTYFQVQVT